MGNVIQFNDICSIARNEEGFLNAVLNTFMAKDPEDSWITPMDLTGIACFLKHDIPNQTPARCHIYNKWHPQAPEEYWLNFTWDDDYCTWLWKDRMHNADIAGLYMVNNELFTPGIATPSFDDVIKKDRSPFVFHLNQKKYEYDYLSRYSIWNIYNEDRFILQHLMFNHVPKFFRMDEIKIGAPGDTGGIIWTGLVNGDDFDDTWLQGVVRQAEDHYFERFPEYSHPGEWEMHSQLLRQVFWLDPDELDYAMKKYVVRYGGAD